MKKEIFLAEYDASWLNEKNAHINTDLAYIKKEELNNSSVWAIYNFQGEKIGFTGSRDTAFAIVRQNELIGSSVH